MTTSDGRLSRGFIWSIVAVAVAGAAMATWFALRVLVPVSRAQAAPAPFRSTPPSRHELAEFESFVQEMKDTPLQLRGPLHGAWILETSGEPQVYVIDRASAPLQVMSPPADMWLQIISNVARTQDGVEYVIRSRMRSGEQHSFNNVPVSMELRPLPGEDGMAEHIGRSEQMKEPVVVRVRRISTDEIPK